MRDEAEDQSDQRTVCRLVGRGHDAVGRETPDESVRNGAEEDGLEEAGVIEKRD